MSRFYGSLCISDFIRSNCYKLFTVKLTTVLHTGALRRSQVFDLGAGYTLLLPEMLTTFY